MYSYIILSFKDDPDQTQEFWLCEDFKKVKDLELELRSDSSVDYYEVHVYNTMIKSWTAPLTRD